MAEMAKILLLADWVRIYLILIQSATARRGARLINFTTSIGVKAIKLIYQRLMPIFSFQEIKPLHQIK